MATGCGAVVEEESPVAAPGAREEREPTVPPDEASDESFEHGWTGHLFFLGTELQPVHELCSVFSRPATDADERAGESAARLGFGSD